jgi:hypothetical protein
MASISEDDGQTSYRSNRRFSGTEKYAAVLRILRGEEPNQVAGELHITLERLRRWERVFLEGGRQSLAIHHDVRGQSWLTGRAGRFLPWGGLVVLVVLIAFLTARVLHQGAQPQRQDVPATQDEK